METAGLWPTTGKGEIRPVELVSPGYGCLKGCFFLLEKVFDLRLYSIGQLPETGTIFRGSCTQLTHYCAELPFTAEVANTKIFQLISFSQRFETCFSLLFQTL
jgi:hypothetical protein